MAEANEDPPSSGGKSADKDLVGGFFERSKLLIGLAVAVLIALMVGLASVVQSADSTRFKLCDTSFQLLCPDSCEAPSGSLTREHACYRKCVHWKASDAAKDELEKCTAPKEPEPKPVTAPKLETPVAAAGTTAPPPPAAGGSSGQHGLRPRPQPPPKPACPAAQELFAVAQSVMASCRPPTAQGNAWSIALSYDASGAPQASVDGPQSKAMCARMLLASPDVKQARPGCRYHIASNGTVSHE